MTLKIKQIQQLPLPRHAMYNERLTFAVINCSNPNFSSSFGNFLPEYLSRVLRHLALRKCTKHVAAGSKQPSSIPSSHVLYHLTYITNFETKKLVSSEMSFSSFSEKERKHSHCDVDWGNQQGKRNNHCHDFCQ